MPRIEPDEPLTAHRLRRMLEHLNYWIRSPLALECIRHGGRCSEHVHGARRAAGDVSYHLHEERKRLDGDAHESECQGCGEHSREQLAIRTLASLFADLLFDLERAARPRDVPLMREALADVFALTESE